MKLEEMRKEETLEQRQAQEPQGSLDPEQALKKSRQTSSPCSNPKSLQKPVDLRVVLGEPGKAQQERMRGRVEQVKAQKFSTTFSHNELNGLCAVSYLTQ